MSPRTSLDQLDNGNQHTDVDIIYDESDDLTGDLTGSGDADAGHYGEDGDIGDGESDDMLDDDMMDKISSSPSIDDGELFDMV